MPVIIAAVVIILVIVLLFVQRATRAGEPLESVEGRDAPDDAETLR